MFVRISHLATSSQSSNSTHRNHLTRSHTGACGAVFMWSFYSGFRKSISRKGFKWLHSGISVVKRINRENLPHFTLEENSFSLLSVHSMVEHSRAFRCLAIIKCKMTGWRIYVFRCYPCRAFARHDMDMDILLLMFLKKVIRTQLDPINNIFRFCLIFWKLDHHYYFLLTQCI